MTYFGGSPCHIRLIITEEDQIVLQLKEEVAQKKKKRDISEQTEEIDFRVQLKKKSALEKKFK